MSIKKVSLAGLVICFSYFIVTFIFVMTGSQSWLSGMEIITVLSGLFMVPFVIIMPFHDNRKAYKLLAIIAATSCMLLTSAAHVVNLTVTTPLIASGGNIPEYFQIGKWPSVEMAVDYLAWGLFMGLGFIFSSFAIERQSNYKLLKSTTLICGMLCILGFFGAVIINENLWYIAPIGYGIGSVVICIELLTLYCNNANEGFEQKEKLM